MQLPKMQPIQIVTEFDEFLSKKNFRFEAVIIGAGALNIMKITTRETIDFDILSPKIPNKLLDFADEFRVEMRNRGIELIEKWFNNGPESLIRDLPNDWKSNTQIIFQGKVITFKTLSRSDLIKSKLFAYCDREEQDLSDLKHLKPTKDELLNAKPWVQFRDGNPGWPKHVNEKFRTLAKALGYEL